MVSVNPFGTQPLNLPVDGTPKPPRPVVTEAPKPVARVEPKKPVSESSVTNPPSSVQTKQAVRTGTVNRDRAQALQEPAANILKDTASLDALRAQVPETEVRNFAPAAGNTYNQSITAVTRLGEVSNPDTYVTEHRTDAVDPKSGQRFVQDNAGIVRKAEDFEAGETRMKADGSAPKTTTAKVSLAQGMAQINRGGGSVRMDLNQVRVQMGQMGLDMKKDGSISLRVGLGKEGKLGTISFTGKSDFGSSDVYQKSLNSPYFVDAQLDSSAGSGASKYFSKAGGSASASVSSQRLRSFSFASHAEATAFKAVMKDTSINPDGSLLYTGHDQSTFEQFKPRLQGMLNTSKIDRSQLDSMAPGESSVIAGGKQFSGGLDGGGVVSVGFSVGGGDGHRYQVSRLDDQSYRVVMQETGNQGVGANASSAPIAAMGKSYSSQTAQTMVADVNPDQVQGDLMAALERAMAGEKVPGIDVKTRITEKTGAEGTSANLIASHGEQNITVHRTIEMGEQTIEETDGKRAIHVGLLGDDHDFASTFRVSRSGDQVSYEFQGQIKSDDPDDLRKGLARLLGEGADPTPHDSPPVGKQIKVSQSFSQDQISALVKTVKSARMESGDVQIPQKYLLTGGATADLNQLRSDLDAANGEPYKEGQAIAKFVEEQGRSGMEFVRRFAGGSRAEISVQDSSVFDGGEMVREVDQKIASYTDGLAQTEDSRGFLQLGGQMQREIDEIQEQITTLKSDASLDGVIDDYRYGNSDEDYMVLKREKLQVLDGRLLQLKDLQSGAQSQSRLTLMHEKLKAAESPSDHRKVAFAIRDEMKGLEGQISKSGSSSEKKILTGKLNEMKQLLIETRHRIEESTEQEKLQAPQTLELNADDVAAQRIRDRQQIGSTRTKTIDPLKTAERRVDSAKQRLKQAKTEHSAQTVMRSTGRFVALPDEKQLMDSKTGSIKEMGIRLREYQLQYDASEDPQEKLQLSERINTAVKAMEEDYQSIADVTQSLQRRIKSMSERN